MGLLIYGSVSGACKLLAATQRSRRLAGAAGSRGLVPSASPLLLGHGAQRALGSVGPGLWPSLVGKVLGGATIAVYHPQSALHLCCSCQRPTPAPPSPTP